MAKFKAANRKPKVSPTRGLVPCLLLIVAGISAHAQVFEGLDLTPKKKPKTRVSVTLTVPVPGAQVFLDGEAAGEPPLAEKVVKPGEHTLKVERPGYRTIEETITAVASKKTDFSYTLVAVGAVVTIDSSTEGATCSIDGGTGIRPISDEMPMMPRRLKMFEPITLPIATPA